MKHKKWSRTTASSCAINSALQETLASRGTTQAASGQHYAQTSKFCLKLSPAPLTETSPTKAPTLTTASSQASHSQQRAVLAGAVTAKRLAAHAAASRKTKSKVYVRDATQAQASGTGRFNIVTACAPKAASATSTTSGAGLGTKQQSTTAKLSCCANAQPASAPSQLHDALVRGTARLLQQQQPPHKLQPQLGLTSQLRQEQQQQPATQPHKIGGQRHITTHVQQGHLVQRSHQLNPCSRSGIAVDSSKISQQRQQLLVTCASSWQQTQQHNGQQQQQQVTNHSPHPAEALQRAAQQRQQQKRSKPVQCQTSQQLQQHAQTIPARQQQVRQQQKQKQVPATVQQQQQGPEQRKPQSVAPTCSRAAGRPQRITSAVTSKAGDSVQVVYQKRGYKLERAAIKAAIPGANLKWINPAAAAAAAGAGPAAVAHTSGTAVAARQQPATHARLAQQKQQQQSRQLLLSRRRQAAAAAAAVRQRQRPPTVGSAASYKLVRVGGRLYYSTPKGLCSPAAARLLKVSLQASPVSGTSGCIRKRSTAAAALAQAGLGVHHSAAFKHAAGAASKLSSRSWRRGKFSAPPAAAAAAGSGGAAVQLLASEAVRVVKRLASNSAVARSLALARARQGAKRAAAKRGLCLHYCRHGKCDLALQGKCEKVHDPNKVAVCWQWLAGQCSSESCRLQHKVVHELMPVCTYFLEGVCSNRDCPYLHVKVAASAPACKAFLQGHCPAGAACTQKHLTPKMVKQLQQQQQQHGCPGAPAAAAGQGRPRTRATIWHRRQSAAGVGFSAAAATSAGGSADIVAQRTMSCGLDLAALLPEAEP